VGIGFGQVFVEVRAHSRSTLPPHEQRACASCLSTRYGRDTSPVPLHLGHAITAKSMCWGTASALSLSAWTAGSGRMPSPRHNEQGSHRKVSSMSVNLRILTPSRLSRASSRVPCQLQFRVTADVGPIPPDLTRQFVRLVAHGLGKPVESSRLRPKGVMIHTQQ
jgi:hypothetical protein